MLDSITAEAIARIQCDIGIENVYIRPAFKGWAILHKIDKNYTEKVYFAKTKKTCEELMKIVMKGGIA